MADRTTGKSHGDPEDERVDAREEGCCPEHKSVHSILIDAEREEATVEKEDADLDGCDCEGVHEWLGVDDLGCQRQQLVGTTWVKRRTLKTLTSVGRLMDQTCAPDP